MHKDTVNACPFLLGFATYSALVLLLIAHFDTAALYIAETSFADCGRKARVKF